MSKTNLSGNDLWDFLCQPKAKPKPALSNAERRRRKKAQQSQAFHEIKEALHEACEAMNLWTPIARVLVTYQVTCHCGATHAQPELHITDKPLVRFRHQRTKEEKICRSSWSETPRTLPIEHRLLSSSSAHCMECINTLLETSKSPPYNPPIQLELFGENSWL